jgi:hypothetical protein
LQTLEKFPMINNLVTKNSVIHFSYLIDLAEKLLCDVSNFRNDCLENDKETRETQRAIWNQLREILYEKDAFFAS